MECNNKNTSLDTILILDCEEEIKSEKLQNHSSLDTVILSYEEELKQKKHRRHYKNKSEHRRRSRAQRNNTKFDRTKFVTQKIHVEKQNFECIINLNTTVCDHKNNHRCDTKDPKSRFKERPVPHCLRQLCSHSTLYETGIHRHSKEHCKAGVKSTRDLNRLHECMKKTKQGINNSRVFRQCSRHEKKPSNEELIPKQNELNISSDKKQLELSYEDISNASLDSYAEVPTEVPTSYKYVVKNSKEDNHESKLDTLIKRAKERERKLVEQSRKKSWYASTPYSDVSSLDFPISCSDVDVSIQSRSTLILEHKEHGYSPSIEGLCQSPTIERYFQHSPKDYLFANFEDNRDFEFEIKTESVDIDAYSPTDPVKSGFDKDFKFEIKTESVDIDAYSPTDPVKSGFDMDFKFEIKTESVDIDAYSPTDPV